MTTPNSSEQFSKHSAELHKKAVGLGHDVKDIGRIGGELATDAAHITEEHISEYYKEGVKKAKGLAGNLETEIKKNPIRALMIASGVGLLLGVLWHRR